MPHAVRPWQYVLEPISGYLLLAEKLWSNGVEYSEGWNFGPSEKDTVSVDLVAQKLVELWGETISFRSDPPNHLREGLYAEHLDTRETTLQQLKRYEKYYD